MASGKRTARQKCQAAPSNSQAAGMYVESYGRLLIQSILTAPHVLEQEERALTSSLFRSLQRDWKPETPRKSQPFVLVLTFAGSDFP